MKQLTRYEADNGRLCETQAEAKRINALLERCRVVNQMLPSAVDQGCEFANGGGYVQHAAGQVAAFKQAVLALIRFEHGSEDVDLFESVSYPIAYRLRCIDARNREWGQPYFAHKGAGEGTMKPWPVVASPRMQAKEKP